MLSQHTHTRAHTHAATEAAQLIRVEGGKHVF